MGDPCGGWAVLRRMDGRAAGLAGFYMALVVCGTAIMIAISMGLPEVATRYLPLGTAYGVWMGIVGTVALGSSCVGVGCFREAGLIIAGIVGLKFFTH